MQRQITTRQSQITTFSSSPCKDRSQHFSRDHAKTDLNRATTDHIHTLTTTHRLLTLSHIAAMHTEAGSTPQAITFLATRRPPMKGGNMRCTSLNMLLLSSLFLSSSGCSGNWKKKQVWLQKVQQFRGNCLEKTFNMFNFCWDINLEHSTPIVLQDTWTYYDTPSALSGCERISSSENTGQVKI